MECISVTAHISCPFWIFLNDFETCCWTAENMLSAEGCGVYCCVVHNGAAAHIDLTNTCDEVGIIIVATFSCKQEL